MNTTDRTITETEYQCARCGSSIEWERCSDCDGEGYVDHEDDEDWPLDAPPCMLCLGKGGAWFCLSSVEWCKANPLPGREAVERHEVETFYVEVPIR